MQTFLPYANFSETARVLDRQRLGKQRVETLQIAKALVTGTGWVNHPATRMWAGHLGSLYQYQAAICYEWVTVRGYRDTCFEKTATVLGMFPRTIPEMEDLIADERWPVVQCQGRCPCRPAWLGRRDVHQSHRSNLLRKAPEHYGMHWPDEPDDLPYVWPH
jgi:hypothetical protein